MNNEKTPLKVIQIKGAHVAYIETLGLKNSTRSYLVRYTRRMGVTYYFKGVENPQHKLVFEVRQTNRRHEPNLTLRTLRRDQLVNITFV